MGAVASVIVNGKVMPAGYGNVNTRGAYYRPATETTRRSQAPSLWGDQPQALSSSVATPPPAAPPPPTAGSDLAATVGSGGTAAYAPVPNTRAQNPLIAQVQDAMSRSLNAQQTDLRNLAQPGREALFRAAPELQAASDKLRQQAEDPLGGGFGADVAERVRVAQAAAGLSQGGQAAFQEAALVSRAGEERRVQAAGQLDQLGQTFLQQLGLGSPLVADLAGIGQFELARQNLAAVQAAGQSQSAIAQQIFQQVQGFLNSREENRAQAINLGFARGPLGYGPITGISTGQGDAL